MSQALLDKLEQIKYDLQVAQGAVANNLDRFIERITEARLLADLKRTAVIPETMAKGFSPAADADGLVEVYEVTNHLLEFPKELYEKCYKKFYFEQAYRAATFPTEDARTKAYLNLSNRRWAVFQFGGSQVIDQAITYSVTETGAPNDYSLPPERQKTKFFRQTGLNLNAASMDWNPAKDAKYIYNWWKGKARQEALALGLKPEDYGL